MTAGEGSAPVLLLIFNRPDLTMRAVEAIAAGRPSRLYVAADGPRADRATDEALCAEARRIAVAVDWECTVQTLFRSSNLGCRVAVSTAVDWFFSLETEGIILEDDCVADPSFFRFTSELLERYRDSETVMAISGAFLLGGQHTPPRSYYFSRYFHVWGWATWRRAWQHNDDAMADWPQQRDSGWLRESGETSAEFIRYWSRTFDLVHRRTIDTWDYPWLYSCWRQGGLSVTPSRNLVKNVGFRPDATHTTGEMRWAAELPLERIEFPLDHPLLVERDGQADRLLESTTLGLGRPCLTRLLTQVVRLCRVLMKFARRLSGAPLRRHKQR